MNIHHTVLKVICILIYKVSRDFSATKTKETIKE